MDDPAGIFNWRRLGSLITTSGQPKEDELAALQALGVRQVINLGLHTHERALADEAGSLARLDIAYTHIPVDFLHPAEDDYARFSAAVTRAAGAPLHVHCIMNFRVTAFFYRYQIDVEGVPETAARAMLWSVWKPGGAWAEFIGDTDARNRDHLYAGRDY